MRPRGLAWWLVVLGIFSIGLAFVWPAAAADTFAAKVAFSVTFEGRPLIVNEGVTGELVGVNGSQYVIRWARGVAFSRGLEIRAEDGFEAPLTFAVDVTNVVAAPRPVTVSIPPCSCPTSGGSTVASGDANSSAPFRDRWNGGAGPDPGISIR